MTFFQIIEHYRRLSSGNFDYVLAHADLEGAVILDEKRGFQTHQFQLELFEKTRFLSAALRSHIPGSALIELPLGSDHTALKQQFALEHSAPAPASPTLPSGVVASGSESNLVSGAEDVPSAKKAKKVVEISAAQAEALGIELD